MDRAPVLGDEVSIRVEELLIIGAVEAIAVDADRISVPQLEPYALWGTRNTTGCRGLQLFSPVASTGALSVVFLMSETARCSPVF